MEASTGCRPEDLARSSQNSTIEPVGVHPHGHIRDTGGDVALMKLQCCRRTTELACCLYIVYIDGAKQYRPGQLCTTGAGSV